MCVALILSSLICSVLGKPGRGAMRVYCIPGDGGWGMICVDEESMKRGKID
jgi:hypothetical protein